ncbi:MAG TPA: hypothetical protein VF817_03360 [Patescibacteria group bacterium]
MKRIIWLAMAMLMALVLGGCGTDNKTVYVTVYSAPASVGTLTFDSYSTMKIQFKTSADGSLQGLECGNHKIFPQNVERVMFTSSRMGNLDKSMAWSVIGSGNIARFYGIPNNDGGIFSVKTKAGDFYQVASKKFDVEAYKEMDFDVTADGYVTFGKQADTSLVVELNTDGKTIKFKGAFGCNLLIGLKQKKVFKSGMSVVFVSDQGASTLGLIIQDPKTDNLNFVVDGVSLENSSQYFSSVRGKFYVLDPSDNSMDQLEFDYNNWDKGYVWYANSNTRGLYPEYDPDTDSVTIEYWP